MMESLKKINLKRILQRAGKLTFTVVQIGCVAHCVARYGVSLVACSGPSMQPTIYTGDIYLVENYTTYTDKLKRGDIVAVQNHTKPKMFICKRIVAMAGDKVYNENTNENVWVPRGHVWLEGDNKENSIDSREYGSLPYALIRSRLIFKIWSKKWFEGR